jgi:hypothetical protein
VPRLWRGPLSPFLPQLPLPTTIADTAGYTADVLQSAQALADHAARTGPQSNRIEKEDVELAIQMRRRYEFFEAPPRDVSWTGVLPPQERREGGEGAARSTRWTELFEA